ncbi:hypothetical protein, partial [Halanaerobaculum tunisiense]
RRDDCEEDECGRRDDCEEDECSRRDDCEEDECSRRDDCEEDECSRRDDCEEDECGRRDDWEEDECDRKDDWAIERKNCKVYGYGRRMRINLKGKNSQVAVDKVDITELAIKVHRDITSQDNLIQYFHTNRIGEGSIALSVLPSGSGKVDSVVYDTEREEAIIEGEALLYIDSKNEGRCDFRLKIRENKINMEIFHEGERISNNVRKLTGVSKQIPFTIEE